MSNRINPSGGEHTELSTLPAHPVIRAAAYAIPMCVAPSALWRLHHVIWMSNDACFRHGSTGENVYVAMLSVVSFGAAFLAVGLVRRWGEVVPSWIPVLGGRVVSPLGATIAASAGLCLLLIVYLYAALNPIFHWRTPPPVNPACPPPELTETAWVAYLAYAPLLLWGPLLAIVTVAYYRRRVAPPTVTDASAQP